MRSKFGVLSIKRRRVHPEELEEILRRERSEEAASTTGSGNTEESAKYRHQSQRQEDAEKKIGGSQGGHPTERELWYSILDW